MMYISFGWGQRHVINDILLNKDTLVSIETDEYEKAMNLAFEYFGTQWSNTYTDSNGLKPVELSHFKKVIPFETLSPRTSIG